MRKSLKRALGRVWSSFWKGFGEGFGKGLEALAASRVDFWHRFFLLVLGMDFKSALGGVRAGFCFDFGGFGGDFGRDLARF